MKKINRRTKKVCLLGSTGSIGETTLKVINSLNGRFNVFAIAAKNNSDGIKKQIDQFSPAYACLENQDSALLLDEYVRSKNMETEIIKGDGCLETIAGLQESDIVIMAVVGFAGLKPLMKAIQLGKRIALANKEVIVSAGEIIMKAVSKHKAEIFPVDSEHSAIFQCLKKEKGKAVRRIILTASGGPFYKKDKESFKDITVEDALKHPNWVMGKKITIDSATLMNKGLEAIEAHHLFNIPMEKIEILIHPQSIVHSMVEFVDGSVLAQLSKPDMALPIRYSLTYPERVADDGFRLDLDEIGSLEFFKPDYDKFPCIKLAFEAARMGGAYPVALNAANEVAVSSFIAGKISFVDIPKIIEKVCSQAGSFGLKDLNDVFTVDSWARRLAERTTT